jgi:hypothetical protein
LAPYGRSCAPQSSRFEATSAVLYCGMMCQGVGFRYLPCGGVGGDLVLQPRRRAQNRSSLVGPVDPHNRLVRLLRQRDDTVAAQTLKAIGNYRAFGNGCGTLYILRNSSRRRVRIVAIRPKLRGLKPQTIEDRRPRIEDRGSMIEDRGQSIFDSRSSMFDLRFTVSRLRLRRRPGVPRRSPSAGSSGHRG